MAWTVEPDLVTFSQFRVSLTRPLSRSRIWRPEKSLAPAAASDGESARRESTAVNCVRTEDLRRRDQSKEVILLPCATWREPEAVAARADGESRPFKGKRSDFWRLKGSN